MCMPTKQQVIANLWSKNTLQPFITPSNIQMYLRQSIFCSSSWKFSLKGTNLRMLLRSKNQ
jgi:hypothetical protein